MKFKIDRFKGEEWFNGKLMRHLLGYVSNLHTGMIIIARIALNL